MSVEPLWRVELESTERTANLLIPFGLDELVGSLVANAHDVHLKIEKGSFEAKGSWRPVITFDVDTKSFDMFFNSPFGYRGQFLAGAAIGRAANVQIVSALARPLLSLVEGDVSEQVLDSVTSEHAKIWIEEGQHDPPGPDLVIEIPVPTWVAAAKAVRVRLDQGDSSLTQKEIDRIYGVRAPEGTKLLVMGAWVTPEGSLHVVPAKFRRSEEIHEYGVS